MTTRALAVVLLVVLAGCPQPAEPQGTDAVSPVPVTETVRYPPGVSQDGVVDPARLADAHVDTLGERSYTIESNRTITGENGTVRSDFAVRVAIARDRTFFATMRTAGPAAPGVIGPPPATATFWGNGSVYVRAYTPANDTTYNEFSPPTEYVGTWRYWRSAVALGGGADGGRSRVREIFRAVPTQVTGSRQVDGRTVYRLEGETPSSSTFATGGSAPVRNVRLTALVTEQGVIAAMHLFYERPEPAGAARVEWTLRYEKIGSTTAPRPEWFDRAIDQSSSPASNASTSTARSSGG